MRNSRVFRNSPRPLMLMMILLVGAVSQTASAVPPIQSGSLYAISTCTGVPIVPGTTNIGLQADDGITTVNLPFPYTLYGVNYSAINVSSNGNIQFGSADAQFTNSCLPYGGMGPTIFAHWDDLYTGDAAAGQGVFTSVSGVTPDRIFNIEWRTRICCNAGAPDIRFEVRLYENQPRFDIVYGTVAGNGGSATVGVQSGTAAPQAQYTCNSPALSSGLRLTFYCIDARPSAKYAIYKQCAAGAIVAGTTDIGIHCDDCATNVPFGFTTTFYGAAYSGAAITSNGVVQLIAQGDSNAYSNECLPASQITGPTIFAYWDDLYTNGPGLGIFTSTSGAAPNRIFNIEFRANHLNDTTPANFEVRIYENQTRFDVVYGNLGARNGIGATIGIQPGGGGTPTQYSCDTADNLAPGNVLTFFSGRAPNVAPVCNAGGPYTAECTGLPIQVQLTGSGSSDPDGYPFAPSYSWSSDCPGATFTPSNTVANPILNLPASSPGTCHVTLTVSDGELSRMCSADVNVVDTVAPIISLNDVDSAYEVTTAMGATIVPGTTDIGNHCDDCTTPVALPFPFTFYGVSYANAFVNSNGTLYFANDPPYLGEACLPYPSVGPTIFAHWDDVRTDSGGGVFTSVTGAAPNRIFNIEWRGVYFYAPGTPVNFEMRLYENQTRIDVVYGNMGGINGTSAAIGIQNGAGQAVQYACENQTLTPGQRVTFEQHCPDYIVTSSAGNALTPGTTNTGINCDDCVGNVALPFPVNFYGVVYNSANVSSNGNIQFGTGSASYNWSACVPTGEFGPAILAHWSDLFTASPDNGQGIFTAVTGVAPNRVFTIEWRTQYCCDYAAPVHDFEVQFFENQHRFDIVYGNMLDNGLFATIGVQSGMGPFTRYTCNASAISNGTRLSFRCDPVVYVECRTPFTDPGVTALDRCAGDLTSQVVRSGSVNVNAPGMYTLTYNVSDPSGYAAIPVSRTVIVGKMPDMNDDGLVNTADAPGFVAVLLGLDANLNHVRQADVNCDGLTDGDDIQWFENMIVP